MSTSGSSVVVALWQPTLTVTSMSSPRTPVGTGAMLTALRTRSAIMRACSALVSGSTGDRDGIVVALGTLVTRLQLRDDLALAFARRWADHCGLD
jgi:hypothetical protein